MLHRLLSAIAVITLLFLAAPEVHAQATLGGGMVYGSGVETAGLKLETTFPIARRFRGAGDLTFYLDDNDNAFDSYWAFNANGHYILNSDGQADFYGLAGLNFTNYKYYGGNDTNTELGVNIGLGGQYHANFGNLYGEVKYVASDLDQLVLGVGVRFPLR